MDSDKKPVAHAKFRIKGTEMEPFDTLQARTIIYLDDLRAAENPEALIVQKALEAATVISEVWMKHKDNIEVSEEGQ